MGKLIFEQGATPISFAGFYDPETGLCARIMHSKPLLSNSEQIKAENEFARFLVAAHNTCLTIPVELLESEHANQVLSNFASTVSEIDRLKAVNADLLEALKGVVRVADRKTVEFDNARTAIENAEKQLKP